MLKKTFKYSIVNENEKEKKLAFIFIILYHYVCQSF